MSASACNAVERVTEMSETVRSVFADKEFQAVADFIKIISRPVQ